MVLSLRVRFGEWIVEPSKSSRPSRVMVELTMKCNYNCIYCFRRSLVNEDITEMDWDLALKVLRDSREAGVEWIVLSGWGEPLTHPRALDFMHKAKSMGFKVLLNTNGSLLSEYAEDLVRMEIDNVTISVDSMSKEEYEKLRAGGRLTKVIEGMSILREAKMKRSTRTPEVNVAVTVTRLNVSTLKDTAYNAWRLGASRMYVSNIIPISKSVEEELACYYNGECIRILEESKMEIAKLGLELGIEVVMPNTSKCYSERECPFMTRKAVYIRSDGLVTPCIYYAHHWRNTMYGVNREIKPIVYGDLRENKLLDVWFSDDYIKFRATAYFMKQPSCIDCPLQEYCTLTLTNEADCWGNTPTCAHCPYSRRMCRCPL